MAFIDLFRRSRSTSAPNAARNRARISLEQLELRLAPTATISPYPASPSVVPPPPSSSTTSSSTQNPPAPSATPAGTTSGGYGISWSSTVQDGTGWNVYPQ